MPWNVFQEGGVDPGAIDYIMLNMVLTSGTKTQMVNGTLNGDLEGWGIKFPTATEGIQVALGGEYREESLYVHPDDSWENGLGSGQGGPTVRVDGKYDVTEFFVEALVPIIQDAPMARDLSLELGYRFSDYSTSGGQQHLEGAGLVGADRGLQVPRRLHPRDARAERARALPAAGPRPRRQR